MANVYSDGGSYSSITIRACRVLRNYAAQITQGFSGSHSGVDIVGSGNRTDSITAHSSGTVAWAQSGFGNNKGSSGNASYGNACRIQHQNGMSTLYAHLSMINVKQGDKVSTGQVIGYMGNTGNSYGAHLHFEVRNSGGSLINGAPFLNSDLTGLGGGGTVTGSSNSSGGIPGITTPSEPEKKSVDVTKVVVKSTQGSTGTRKADDLANNKLIKNGAEILIQKNNSDTIFAPIVEGDITLEWARKNSPGVLRFNVIKDSKLKFDEGCPVSFRYNGKNVFYGYVFTKSSSDSTKMTVTCYDQLRYLKNKTSMAYGNKKYSEVLKIIANDYKLKCGAIEDTSYKIPQRIEDGTLFDILGNASDLTVLKNGKLFVLYDDFGKITLKNIESMKVPLLVDETTGESYSYSTTIDKDVYSKIVLASDNDQTGERELHIVNNADLQKRYGVLQYYESVDNASVAEIKAQAKLMANYYGKISRSLKLKKVLGDIQVRGGSSLVVMLNLGDMQVQNYMVVEKVSHSFSNGLHTMDLDVSGIRGEFVV